MTPLESGAPRRKNSGRKWEPQSSFTTASVKLEASSLQAFGKIVTAKRSSHFLAPQVFGQGSEVNCLRGGCHRLSSELWQVKMFPGPVARTGAETSPNTKHVGKPTCQEGTDLDTSNKPKNHQSLNQTTAEPKSPPRTGENPGESQSRCESLPDLTVTLKGTWPMLRDPTLDKNLTYPMQFGDQYQRVSRPRPQPHFNDYQHWDSPC